VPFVIVVNGERHPIGQGIVVGNADSADVRVVDETVSRRHVRLTPAGNRVHVVDEDSKNGTFVGEVRVGEAWVGRRHLGAAGPKRSAHPQALRWRALRHSWAAAGTRR
jgi:pSer/pThr/pTyr-binding forkhead associated (FHA) protein